MNYYTTASVLPIYNFQEILNTNDLRYLYVVKFWEGEQLPTQVNESDLIMLSNAWGDIQNEIPQNEAYSDLLILYRDKAILKGRKALTDKEKHRDRYYDYVNQLSQLEHDIKRAVEALDREVSGEKKEADLLTFLIAINSKLGINMNFHRTSIKEFMYAEKMYNDIVMQEKKQYEEMKRKNKNR